MRNKTSIKQIDVHASSLVLAAGLFMSVSHALGYPNPIEGGSAVTVTNTWIVPGGELYVGQTTSGNSLILSNGVVYNTHGYIGSHAGADSNSVTVVRGLDGGSGWHNTQALYLGGYREGTNWVNGGFGNRLDMSFVWVFVGEMDPNIDDTRFTGIVVGDASGTSEMVIANGSQVISPNDSYIGYGTHESGTVVVRGSGSIWDTRTRASAFRELVVGKHGSNNRLFVSDGGLVLFDSAYLGHEAGSVNNVLLVVGEGSRLDGMSVYVGDYGSDNRLAVADGGIVESFSALIGVNSGSDDNSVQVTGTGAELHTGMIQVGYQGAGNMLSISDGGEVHSSRAYVGSNPGAVSNAVFVTGLGSVWDNARALRLGDGGRGNALHVNDGGLVSVGEGMFNRNYSTVAVDDPESRIVIGENYYQDATSSLRFGVTTSNPSLEPLLRVGGTAEFEAGAQLQYHYEGDVGWMDFDTFFTNLIVEANQLMVGGVTNALDLDVIKLDDSLVDLTLWEKDQDLYGLVGRKYLADSAGFAPGTQMARLANEIDGMSLLSRPNAVGLINLLNRMSTVQRHQQLTQAYEQGTPNYLHVQGMTQGMDEIKKRMARHSKTAAPDAGLPGAAGPYNPDQEMQVWVKPYGSWTDRSSGDGFSGYDHNIYGTVVGMDQPNGDALIGIAGGYARSNIKQDDGDRSEAKGGYGVIYASWGTDEWFQEVNLAYGRSDVDDRSGTAFGNKADYDASTYAFYYGLGKELTLDDGDILFTPKASVLCSYYYQEEYTEESVYVAREVDSYDYTSVMSRLGASIAYPWTFRDMAIKPEARLYWLHEFNSDIEKANYSLRNGMGGRYHYYMPEAMEDVGEAGLGINCNFNEDFALSFDIDWRFGEDYSAYSVSGRAVVEF